MSMGAFRRETSSGSCGFIIRNSSGEPVMAGAANISPVPDAMMAETVACKFAWESAELYGISRTVVETDSSLLRAGLITNSSDLAPEGILLRGIRELLADQFSCACIRSVPRSCNVVAHEFVKLSMN